MIARPSSTCSSVMVSAGSTFMTVPPAPLVSMSMPRSNAARQTAPASSPEGNSMPRARPRPRTFSCISGAASAAISVKTSWIRSPLRSVDASSSPSAQ